MIGTFIIFCFAVAIVVTYVIAVNRFLRADEHWDENSDGAHHSVDSTPAPAPKHGVGMLHAKHA